MDGLTLLVSTCLVGWLPCFRAGSLFTLPTCLPIYLSICLCDMAQKAPGMSSGDLEWPWSLVVDNTSITVVIRTSKAQFRLVPQTLQAQSHGSPRVVQLDFGIQDGEKTIHITQDRWQLCHVPGDLAYLVWVNGFSVTLGLISVFWYCAFNI